MINFFFFFFFSLIFKLVIGYFLPLSFDEAYYWVWSHHLQLSYFDHPGFVSWLFYLGHPFEGWGGAVRFPAIIFGHLTLLIWYFILKPVFDSKQILYWILFIILSPLLGIGLVIITPDIPLLVFWSLSILFLFRSIDEPSKLHYSLLGASLGLGLCSKYHIVIFLFSLLASLIFNKEFRNSIKWTLVPLTLIFGFIFSLPVLYWNFKNDFISFKFQLDHGLTNKQTWNISWSLEYILGQIFLLFPPIVWLALKNNERRDSKRILFHSLAWVPLGFFLVSSFKSTTEPNWPIAAHLSVFALILGQKDISKIFKSYFAYWFIIYSILCTALFNKDWKWADKLREPSYYDSVYSVAQTYSPLYTESYQMASKFWFYYKRPFYKLRGMSRLDFFDFLHGSIPDQSPFYLLKEIDHELPSWMHSEKYSIKQIKSIQDRFEVLEILKK